ncbi:MAG: CRISPR-associated endonuclease Cas3'' [Candidatus Omnitrophota bacterium]
MMNTILAHTPPKRDSNLPPHPLKEHLKSVSELCASFAKETLPHDPTFIDSARVAGWLHDVGKYGDLFQKRLQGKEKHIDHWSAGAYVAAKDFKELLSSSAILGHHLGLQPFPDLWNLCNQEKLAQRHPLNLKLSEANTQILLNRFKSDFPEATHSTININKMSLSGIPLELDLRLLFSCLVDADFLDTEAHFNRNGEGKQFRRNGPPLDASKGV